MSTDGAAGAAIDAAPAEFTAAELALVNLDRAA